MNLLKVNLTFAPRALVCAIRPLLAFALLALPASGAFPNGYSYCKVVTIQSTMVSGAADLANYPLTLILTDADLKTVANGGLVNHGSGYDIAFYPDCSGSGVALKWEMESYNPATGAIVAHVLRPTLSHTANDTLGMYYGGSFATFQSTVSAVWADGHFGFVYHAGNGTTLSLSDSTGAQPITNLGVTAWSAGKIDGAGSFASASSTYLSVADAVGLRIERTDSATWSAWINPTSLPSFPMILQKMAGAPTYRGWQVYVDSGNSKLAATLFSDNSGSKQITRQSSATISTGVWTHVVVTYDGSSVSGGLHLYLNGVLRDGASDGFTINTSTATTDPMNIGRRAKTSSLFWNGKIDEVRVSKGLARSSDWILTEYRNQSAPGTYISTGPRIVPSGNHVKHSVNDGI